MKLEWLATELLLDLFEYLDIVHLILAFGSLNTRFDTLLFTHFRSYRLDFRSISKTDFDIICEQYSPLIMNQVSSLSLSNGDETPQLPDHFFSLYGFTVDEFPHLRSLALHHIDSSERILKTISDCSHLQYLTHLKIVECNIQHEKNLITDIWRLSKLTHFHLNVASVRQLVVAGLTVISPSIRHLVMKNLTCSSIELAHLFKHTPRLRHLCVSVGPTTEAQLHPIALASSLTSLKLHVSGSPPVLTNVLRSTPNLHYLTLQTRDIYLNGHEWKQTLIDHLPKIKVFRLLMKVFSSDHNHTDEQLDDLLNTFRTRFWLEEHRWFVRYDRPQYTNKAFSLYTLPYCFDDTYVLHQNRLSKSTCPNDRHCQFYDRVSNVFYKGCLDDFVLFSARYPNIRRLTVKLPFDNNFWSVIPTLDHLTFLEVIGLGNNPRSESQLQALLDRAPRLDSLIVDAGSVLPLTNLKMTHTSIRRLQLKHYLATANRYLNAEQSSSLATSPLGSQCEVLRICVEHRANALDLVNTMLNLRALICECQDDKWTDKQSPATEDELVEWLEDHLPDTCSVQRVSPGSRLVRLWIRK